MISSRSALTELKPSDKTIELFVKLYRIVKVHVFVIIKILTCVIS